MRSFLFLNLAMAAAMTAHAGEQRFASGPARTSLVELYTSEGCSSCPPAERWLGTLRDQPGLWRDFVPVEFHVNYWDRLGWPDRFASRDFTQREYDYSSAWGAGSVYTPCVVRDGAESRVGVDLHAPAGTAPGVLTVVVGTDGKCRVEFTPVAGGRTAYEAHFAWLGGGITSRVTAGENRGETLRHEFVALALASRELVPVAGTLQSEFTRPRPADSSPPRRAIAAWVTRRGDPVPIQAVGGWLQE
ncbi:MAG: DUF1223 domain-containing protein [Pseudomonadota bacterium]